GYCELVRKNKSPAARRPSQVRAPGRYRRASPARVDRLAAVRRNVEDGAVVVAVTAFAHTGMLLHELDDLQEAALTVDVGDAQGGFQRTGTALLVLPQAVQQDGRLRVGINGGVAGTQAVRGFLGNRFRVAGQQVD